MKKLALSALSLVFSVAFSQAQFVDLVSLGSGSYTIEPSVSIGTYSQNATGTTFSPSVSLGDTVGGSFGPLDWTSSATDLASSVFLKIAFTGANPLLPMTVQIFNSDFSLSNSYQGTTTPILADPNYFQFDLVGAFTPAVLSDAGGVQITWDGGSNVNANLQALAVPEPSTYALLAISGVTLGGYVMRRRKRA